MLTDTNSDNTFEGNVTDDEGKTGSITATLYGPEAQGVAGTGYVEHTDPAIICLPLAQSANLHVGNNWNVLKLLIWRVSVVLASVITPPAQARELVLAQGSQVDQYLAAVIVAIKAYDRLLGMRQLQALVLNPDTSPMMRQHLLGRIKSIRATYPKFFWSASVENDNRNFATDTMLITLNGQQLPYTV